VALHFSFPQSGFSIPDVGDEKALVGGHRRDFGKIW
jgi:hypothetical protein